MPIRRPRAARNNEELPIETVIAAAKSGSHSPLYEYLWRNYDQLLPELNRGTNWGAMAEQFKSNGIKAGRGTDPTDQSVRQTWYRVRLDKDATQAAPKKNALKDQWKG